VAIESTTPFEDSGRATPEMKLNSKKRIMSARKKTKPTDSPGEQSFEKSLEGLQEIVNQLEEGTLGLEESMGQFENGVKLLRRCYALLENAEQKIERLTGFDEEGKPIVAPFESTATIEKSTATKKKSQPEENEDDDEDENARLF